MGKWILILAGVVVMAVVSALAALPWVLNTPAFQSYVGQAAAHALSRPIKFAALSIAPFPVPSVKLRGLQIAEDPAFGRDPFLTVGEGRLRIRLRPLLSGRVELVDLVLEEPRIELIEDQAGHWNWASLGIPTAGGTSAPRSRGRSPGAPATAVLLSRVSIVKGTMRYQKVGVARSEIQADKVNVTVSQESAGGALRLRGDALVQPGAVQLTITDASLIPGAGRSFADMVLKATVEIEARDVASLGQQLMGIPAAGSVKGRLEVSGTPTRIVATGAMGVDRLILTVDRPACEPRRRHLQVTEVRVPLSYNGLALDSAPLQAKVARGSVAVRLGLDLGPTRVATLKNIDVKGMELEPVLVDFACQPYAVTGPLDLAGQATLRIDDPRRSASGSGRLRVGSGKVMGREVTALINQVVEMAGVASAALAPEQRVRPSSPLTFESITATYTITNGVLATKDLLYRGRDVTVAGAGTVALPDGRVNMQVTLTQGPNQIKGVVSGTVDALRVVPTSIDVPDTRRIKKFLDMLLR
jgi:AsmA protein